MGVISLHGIKASLLQAGIQAKVFDSYTYPELGSWTVLIETDAYPAKVQAWLDPMWPCGVQMIIRSPICICFGPPSRNCPIHKV